MAYESDSTKIITDNVPELLQSERLLALLACLSQPFVLLYDKFIEFSVGKRSLLQHDARIIYLTKILNDTFDNTSRRISIVNSELLEPLYIYLEVPVYLDNSDVQMLHYWYKPASDYTVMLPDYLASVSSSVVTLLSLYNVAGKKYRLFFYEYIPC